MTKAVTDINGTDVSKMLADMYAEGKTYMARLAHVVFEAAEKGDKVAIEILNHNIKRFSAQLSSALAQLPLDERFDIVLAGGITHFAESFVEELKQNITSSNLNGIKILGCEPVVGAVLLAGAPEVKEKEN